MVDHKFSLRQRIVLWLGGRVYVGHEGPEKHPGFREPTPFYVFRCSRHGLKKSHPAGYDDGLYCDECMDEGLAEFERKNPVHHTSPNTAKGENER